MNKLTFLQEETLNILIDVKKKSPITGKRLAFLIGLKENHAKEGADMRSIIHALRTKNYPICANTKGYYYASTSTELSEFIVSLNGRISKMQEAVEGLNRSFDKVKEIEEEQTTKLF